MVVGEQDPRAAVERRVRYNRSDGKGRVACTALMPGQVQALTLSVQVRDPQALSSRVGLGEATREEVAGGCRSVQLERLFGTLIAHLIQLCG